jgi:hypothetical protein
MIEDSELAAARQWRPPSRDATLGVVEPRWRVIGRWRDDDEFFFAFIPAVDEGSAVVEAYQRYDPLRVQLEITEVARA